MVGRREQQCNAYLVGRVPERARSPPGRRRRQAAHDEARVGAEACTAEQYAAFTKNFIEMIQVCGGGGGGSDGGGGDVGVLW